jgi:hypothetical protein
MTLKIQVPACFRFVVFKATFNDVTAISWRSDLLEETEGPGKNQRPAASQ